MRKEISCHLCPLRKRGCHSPNTEQEIDFIQSFKEYEREVAAGQPILREGTASDELFTLREGWAFRYRTLPDGRRQILNFLLPGDFIGLQAEINGKVLYGVEALTTAHVCVFRRHNLWDLYRKFPSLGYDLTWLSAHQELIVDENLLSVGRRSASERIAMLLVHLHKRAEAIGDHDPRGIIFPIRQQHIADALGLSLVHTNKTMRRLEGSGLHEIRGGRLKIRNIHALQKLAEYDAIPLRNQPLI